MGIIGRLVRPHNPQSTFIDERFAVAFDLIGHTPGYEKTAKRLRKMLSSGRLLYAARLPDRAVTHLSGKIQVGSEAIDGNALSLAETLVHEAYHLDQNPFQKTVSFWTGIFTGSHPMRRYEYPAYRAAIRFLRAFAANHPELADDAEREIASVESSFAANYGNADFKT